MMTEMRLRADGTHTYSSPEWDATWYWPVGTRVTVGHLGTGVVIKQNTTTANVRMDADGSVRTRVGFAAMARVQ